MNKYIVNIVSISSGKIEDRFIFEVCLLNIYSSIDLLSFHVKKILCPRLMVCFASYIAEKGSLCALFLNLIYRENEENLTGAKTQIICFMPL